LVSFLVIIVHSSTVKKALKNRKIVPLVPMIGLNYKLLTLISKLIQRSLWLI
jgi:hypothetical protein